MANFYTLKVKEVKKETKDAVSITFDVPEDLKDKFAYKPGQYLTLKIDIDGETYRRPYSLCSSPAVDNDLKVTSKRVEGGVISNYLNDNIKEGDEIDVFPPIGRFTTEVDSDNQRTFVMFGGGSGITPLMSILKTVLHKEPMSMVMLFYGNEDEESIIFRDELDALQKQFNERLKLIYTLEKPSEGWQHETGMLNKQKILGFMDKYAISNEDDIEYFICGPQGMIDEAKAALKERVINPDHIHIEYFTAPLPDLDKEEEKQQKTEGGEDFEEADVTIILDGEEHHIKVRKDEKILEAAIDEGIDPPFACQMGICTTCMAFLHEGQVKMDENEGLSDAEVEEGYILTCQSHPMTAKVKVEYE